MEGQFLCVIHNLTQTLQFPYFCSESENIFLNFLKTNVFMNILTSVVEKQQLTVVCSHGHMGHVHLWGAHTIFCPNPRQQWKPCSAGDYSCSLFWGGPKLSILLQYTLLKSDVTTCDHVVRCRGSQECGSRNVNFACKFHRRSHRVRITLKSTTLLFMRRRTVWTTKPWQRS